MAYTIRGVTKSDHIGTYQVYEMDGVEKWFIGQLLSIIAEKEGVQVNADSESYLLAVLREKVDIKLLEEDGTPMSW